MCLHGKGHQPPDGDPEHPQSPSWWCVPANPTNPTGWSRIRKIAAGRPGGSAHLKTLGDGSYLLFVPELTALESHPVGRRSDSHLAACQLRSALIGLM